MQEAGQKSFCPCTVAPVNQDVWVLSVMVYCSQAFPPETIRLGILVTCYCSICGKIGILISEPEPNVSEQFYMDLRRKPNERTSCILNYQINKGISDTYVFTFCQTD